MVKTLPAMQETSVRSLTWEDPLEEGMVTHSSILAWRILWTAKPGRLHTVHGVAKSRTQLSSFHFHTRCRSRRKRRKTSFPGQKGDDYDGTNVRNFPSLTFSYVNTSKLYLTNRLAT